jgi:Tfp pilus assembly protein PilX
MKNMSYKKIYFNRKGFAMLFTVLVVSLMLSIGIGISNITYKQTILSSLAKDSQIAFYQADGGVECGMYYDVTKQSYPLGASVQNVPDTIWCGDEIFTINDSQSADDYFVYQQKIDDTSRPCATLLIDKKTEPGVNIVQSRGYNICSSHPRQVERALEVRY